MLMPSRFSRPTWPVLVTLSLAFGCSLRDLEYLQLGPGSDSTGDDNLAGTSTSTATTGISTSSTSTGSTDTLTVEDDSQAGTSEGSGADEGMAVDSTRGDAGGSTGEDVTGMDPEPDDDTGDPSGTAGLESTSGDDTTTETTSTVPVDGNWITNGSFENGYTGWTFDPPELQGSFVFVQWPPAGSTNPDGQNELSTWSDQGDFAVSVYQTIEGLPDGSYTFTGNFNRGDGHNATQLFARNCGGEDIVVDIPLTAPTQWIEHSIPSIPVTGGTCEVGMLVDSPASAWLNSDLFSFTLDPE